MLNRRALIEFACPTCTNEYGALPGEAGKSMTCTNCKTSIPIPTGLTPRLVNVGTVSGFSDRMPVAQDPVARQDDDKKVKLNLGKWLGMEVDVDGKTRNAMATTFLGGLLVAIGAIIAAKFGFKSRT